MTLEEENKVLILLTSLPNSYENLVTIILYEKETVKMEKVVLHPCPIIREES